MTAHNNGTPTVRVQAVGKATKCRECGAPIVWIRTATKQKGKARK